MDKVIDRNDVTVSDGGVLTSYVSNTSDLARPLHIQRLESSLNVDPFLSCVEEVLTVQTSDDEGTSDSGSDIQLTEDEVLRGDRMENGIVTTRNERQMDKARLYNFSNLKKNRRWLRDVLLSDSSEDSSDNADDDDDGPITEQDLQELLRMHVLQKKLRAKFHSNPENFQYQYYSAGLLSNFDKFPEHQKLYVGSKKKKKEKKKEKKVKKIKKEDKERQSIDEYENQEYEGLEDGEIIVKEDDDLESLELAISSSKKHRGKKKAQQAKNPEAMALKRKKLWVLMAKKELGKIQRSKLNNRKEVLTNCKRMAQACMKFWRQKAMQSQKNMKEVVWRAKRLTREMQAYWKRYDRVERETKRRLEKEAEEQRKLDVELMEAKRQQRKLNFLITQTELYAHFMSRKLGGADRADEIRILSQLEEAKNPRLAAIDDYDGDVMKNKAMNNVRMAFQADQAKTKQFDTEVCRDFSANLNLSEPDLKAAIEHPQPKVFHGVLKHYQLKGMNWLANLYNQGINGILADEMGLGKTVQSIAFLAHISEKNNIWGPFLIISPASTLHNWQQEVARFVPEFKVVPYWGSPQERKILRQFWDQKNMHTKEASFHVVITSYQLVITDFKYFNRIKWQYMILDEAQAIKSTNSVRWKLLLGFSCRNRLLLSGTPIQNSMAELWALLHFIMPTLFDSHDEFNEWFSRDIESHAENKTSIDEKHLSRLHMILKPFMLRRIKKDVENELSDKIEIMVYCPLTRRQKLLYSALKKKIRIEDLLHSSGGNSTQSSQSVTSSLMNLVMQFRKVCNHPELFERREAHSPFTVPREQYVMPKLIFQEGLLHRSVPSKDHLLYNKFCISYPENVHRSLFPQGCDDKQIVSNSFFSFTRFVDISPGELYRIALHDFLFRLMCVISSNKKLCVFRHQWLWAEVKRTPSPFLTYQSLLLECEQVLFEVCSSASEVLSGLVFTSQNKKVYAHLKHVHHSMPETIQHRIMRSRKVQTKLSVIKSEDQQLRKILEGDKKEALPKDGVPRSPVFIHKHHPSSPPPQSTKLAKSPPSGKVAEISDAATENKLHILPEFPHIVRSPKVHKCVPTEFPAFLDYTCPKVASRSREVVCSDRSAAWWQFRHKMCTTQEGLNVVWFGELSRPLSLSVTFFPGPVGGISALYPCHGWSNILVPDKQTLVTDAGKLYVLDGLLKRLKEQGHRVLIYSQMTRMIDLLEEYMWHRKHTYMRLDGSSKISDRRDMVADFQTRSDIFVFLLSTRAGGLGINLTAADTVIFYDSDWNPTVDQQAMDRAHRLGQTKQVTVYRLVCKGTIEERILQRAREKSEIQRMVISGGNFKPDTLKPKEVVSLLLDDEEIEKKYRQRQAERRQLEEHRADLYRERDRERKRKQLQSTYKKEAGIVFPKRARTDDGQDADSLLSVDSAPASPSQSEMSQGSAALQDDTSNDGLLVVDVDSPASPATGMSPLTGEGIGPVRPRPGRGSGKRGRPRGSRRAIGGRGRMLEAPRPAHSHDPSAPARRGPGRPRLRPYGPGHQGTRKPPRIMQVPLGSTHQPPSQPPQQQQQQKPQIPQHRHLQQQAQQQQQQAFRFYTTSSPSPSPSSGSQ